MAKRNLQHGGRETNELRLEWMQASPSLAKG